MNILNMVNQGIVTNNLEVLFKLEQNSMVNSKFYQIYRLSLYDYTGAY